MKSPSVPTSFANDHNEIDLQLHFKCRAKTVGWPANADHFEDCVRKTKKERKQTKKRHAQNKKLEQWTKQTKIKKTTDTPPNNKFNSTPIQTKPFWEYKREKKSI